VTKLCDADPYHAEWEFVSKIYSYVRDQAAKVGTEAKMKDFLTFAIASLNMVKTNVYLEALNWTLDTTRDSPELVQTHRPRVFKATPGMNGFELFFECLRKPENLMTTSQFAAADGVDLSEASTSTGIIHEGDSSFVYDFEAFIATNPVVATSIIFQGLMNDTATSYQPGYMVQEEVPEVPEVSPGPMIGGEVEDGSDED
jgi:hypothetical protein